MLYKYSRFRLESKKAYQQRNRFANWFLSYVKRLPKREERGSETLLIRKSGLEVYVVILFLPLRCIWIILLSGCAYNYVLVVIISLFWVLQRRDENQCSENWGNSKYIREMCFDSRQLVWCLATHRFNSCS